jgi:drug/metabolite transporter (DMT)-like permease
MRSIARIVLIGAGVFWGLGFIGNKYILDSGWTDIQLLFVRFVSAYLFVTVFFFKRVVHAQRETKTQGLFLGLFLFLGFFFQTWGLEHTTASNNALITAGYIMILPIIVWVFDKVKVPKTTIIAALVTLVGIATISVDVKELTIQTGDILTFIGAVFWAVHIYFLSHQSKQHDLISLMSYQLLSFSLLVSIILFLTDGLPQERMGFDGRFPLWLVGLWLGFTASFLAFLMQAFGQKHTSASEAAILISTESVFGPVFAIVFYGEPFSIKLLIGMIFVFGGIVLSELSSSMQKE